MNANEIPRRKRTDSKGTVMVELSSIYMFGTDRLKRDMPDEEFEDFIQEEGIYTLPDMSLAVDSVMTINQCREMFKTGKYPEGLGEELGFDMQEE